MAAFDRINTAGVRLEEALALAEAAERSRDFRPTLNGLAVGLSTGTSGRRGVFLASPAERRRWVGMVLAKLLPEAPLARRSVAFFLRADSRLYQEAARSGRIAFHFFDLLRPLELAADALNRLQPDVLIAPAGVLRLLAEMQENGRLAISPERVVSVAEVLGPDDRVVVERAFRRPLGEVYQATEGLLAVTCERGLLHLNEAFVLFEREWIDRSAGRFTPVITDLTRSTQPVVRYRLDDVLVASDARCGCGRASAVISMVEGRCDDICTFVARDGRPVRVFPDFITRAVLGAAAGIQDFRALQPRPGELVVTLRAADASTCQVSVDRSVAELAAHLGALPPSITFQAWEDADPARKRQRVRMSGEEARVPHRL